MTDNEIAVIAKEITKMIKGSGLGLIPITALVKVMALVIEELPSESDVVPKYKVGDRVTVTSDYDTFDTTIIAIKYGKYFFELEGHLPIERQDAQMKLSEPVYEWQWYAMIDGLATIRILDGKHFFTEKEAVDCAYILRKIDETKRVRKD